MAKKVFTFNEIAVGTDAEVFFVDARGLPVSSEGWLGGRKGMPIDCDGGGYLEDCVTAELNVDPVPVSQGAEQFLINVKKCIKAVSIQASKLDLTTSIVADMLFDPAQLKSEQARESGCSPTYDAWELRVNDTLSLAGTCNRFAAGDIHVSWPNPDDFPYSRVNVARMMDIIIGMNEIIHTTKSIRSDWFGKSGSHRPTPYGVEYKAVSNFWLAKDSFIRQVFSSAIKCVEMALPWQDGLAYENSKRHVQNIRSTWDKTSAIDFLRNEIGVAQWK